MKKLLFCLLLGAGASARAQTAYFIDGYHGGIYGHIPSWQTRFMVDKLRERPDWAINLELEPESWDTIKLRNPAAYAAFRLLADSSRRVEYVNPTYGQPYLWNISGESMIRQFYYGMQKLREHFPSMRFTTYSSEEPCFTSALPGVLRSYGFKYASLKNPNTCWGGYARAYGGELVSWIGPDGTGIRAVPRYAMEALKPQSVWETIAVGNSEEYIKGALAAGIKHPVGMTLQDAGWKFGPWLRGHGWKPSEYTTWRNYFERITVGEAAPSWRLTQEDVQVSLMWGAQILQRIAQQVRAAENLLIQAEKVAAMRVAAGEGLWPGDSLDVAWKSLLLAQHHDCWIVPYNGKEGDTWIDKVGRWTGTTRRIAEGIIGSGGVGSGEPRIYNTASVERTCFVKLGQEWKQVTVPAMGQSNTLKPVASLARAERLADGRYMLRTDVYAIIVGSGGEISSLKLRGREYAGKGFGVLRGYFYREGRYFSSADSAVEVRIVEEAGPRAQIEIRGAIAGHPFTELLTVTMGEPVVDIKWTIDWKGNPGIGESGGPSSDREVRKSYYDDRYKLLALFPPAFGVRHVYKDAPFDVTESRLSNTFFNSWDSIKNNIMLRWVDVEDAAHAAGLTLLTDHTTSYVNGEGYPLAATVQYSGNGIFYRNYGLDGPTELHFGLMPHAGKWDAAGVQAEVEKWNEPVLVTGASGAEVGRAGGGTGRLTGRTGRPAGGTGRPAGGTGRPTGGTGRPAGRTGRPTGRTENAGADRGLVKVPAGWQVTSMRAEGRDLLVRVFNAGGVTNGVVTTGFGYASARLEELNGRAGARVVKGVVRIPRFGVRTIRCKNIRPQI